MDLLSNERFANVTASQISLPEVSLAASKQVCLRKQFLPPALKHALPPETSLAS